MNRIPDRSDTPPEQARFIEGIKPVFAPVEVLGKLRRLRQNFSRGLWRQITIDGARFCVGCPDGLP
jgi:hypothetical protein